MMMKNLRNYRCGGMTLVEIMVAVAITVGLMLLIGNVFKSATDIAGFAMANNELMGSLRTSTRLLDQDLSGLRPDMPMAIIFEAHTSDPADPAPWLGDPEDSGKVVRYDRICFFANGNYQPNYSSDFAGNMARIYYGQMLNSPLPVTQERPVAPPRQVLARRFKILTARPDIPTPAEWRNLVNSGTATSGEIYDFELFERTSASYWQILSPDLYANYYFNQDLSSTNSLVSMVRPIDYDMIQNAITDYRNGVLAGEHPYGYDPCGEDALQRLYLHSDVTDFKIQLYLFDKVQSRWRWFPDEKDFTIMANLVGATDPLTPFAFYWNVRDMDIVLNPTAPTLPTPLTGTDHAFNSLQVPWWSDSDDAGLKSIFSTTWPKAMRFTFTVHDKNRQRFPEGQTFSYIVKVPSRY